MVSKPKLGNNEEIDETQGIREGIFPAAKLMITHHTFYNIAPGKMRRWDHSVPLDRQ